MSESLSVRRTDRDDCVVLVVRGDLDLSTEGQLLAAAVGVLQERLGRPVVLDLSGVRFVASIGYSELLMIRHEATTSGQEARIVAGRNDRLRHLAKLLGALPIYDSVEDADSTPSAGQSSVRALRPEPPADDPNRLGA